MPAQRTCVVLRQRAALIHIPANFAPPADDLLLSLDLLRLRLQLILVIRICQRSAVAAHLGFRHLCNEQRMRAEVNTVRHLAAEPRAGTPVQIRYATFVCRHRQAVQLIDVATALHTEVLNGLKRAAVIQRAQRKPPAFLNKRAGVIRIQHRNRHAHRAPRDLHAGIHNAGVRLFPRFCRQQKHAVCQIIKRFVIHFAPPIKIIIITIFIITDRKQKVKRYFRCMQKGTVSKPFLF